MQTVDFLMGQYDGTPPGYALVRLKQQWDGFCVVHLSLTTKLWENMTKLAELLPPLEIMKH